MARRPKPPDTAILVPADRPPALASRHSRRRGADPFGLYRTLAGFPGLDSYRAKFSALAVAAVGFPLLLLLLVIVLGAGRLSGLVLIATVVVLGGAMIALLLVGIERLLRPLQLARRALDSLAHQQDLPRMDLPGSDDAAQILRGVQSVIGRLRSQEEALAGAGLHDELTGLLLRSPGRVRLQALAETECRRGRQVRIVLADVAGMASFNARFGPGHGDALLRALAGRIARIAGDEGVAVRWSGDAFLLAQGVAPEEGAEALEHLDRPLVVRGSPDPMRLGYAEARASTPGEVDAAIAQAEAQLRGTMPL